MSLLSAYISIFVVGIILDRMLVLFERMGERRRRKAMGDWILVRDRLPEKDGTYFVVRRKVFTLADRVSYFADTMTYKTLQNGKRRWMYGNTTTGHAEVVAWMPVRDFENILKGEEDDQETSESTV